MNINILIVDKNNNVIGTVGWFYYSKMSIKELLNMYCINGNKLRFGFI